MATSALAVLSNTERNPESLALAVSILAATIAKAYNDSVDAAVPAPAAPAPAAPVPVPVPAATAQGHSTTKWRSYCEPTVDGETVISTRRTVKGNFVPTEAERNLNIVMDKSTGSPALLYKSVRYFSPNSLVIGGRAADSQKLYVLRDGVWKSLHQLAHAEVNPNPVAP